MNIPVLILPGLSDSGPTHWQTLWHESHPEFKRVAHHDWFAPDRDQWIASIGRTIDECVAPPIVIAHSLGCIALAHCVASTAVQLAGAMLVAPADAERPDTKYDISNFAPVPRVRFDFPSVLIASSNDPWCTIGRARTMAGFWGSRLVNAGSCGHINVDSGFGPWPAGEALLHSLTEECSSTISVT